MHKSELKEAVTSLHDLSAVDLIAGYRAKQFSPSEVLEDVLTHIAVWEPHIKALYAFDPEGARATAKASTERWRKDQPIGALDGIPVTIRTILPPRASRCRLALPPRSWCRRPWMPRRRRDCAKRAP